MFRALMLAVAALGVGATGCYDPTVAAGIPCSASGACPAGQTCAGPNATCVADGTRDGSVDDDAALVDAAPDAPPDAAPDRPQFRGISMVGNGAMTVTLATPPGTQPGDLLLVHASSDSADEMAIVAEAGWTRVQARAGVTGGFAAAVFARIAPLGVGSYTFSYPGLTNFTYMFAFGGVDRDAPIDTSRAILTGSGTTSRIPSVIATRDRAMLVGLITQDLAMAMYTPLPEMTTVYNEAPGQLVMVGGYASLATAGSTGDREVTTPDAGPSIGIAVVLAPAGP